MESVMAAASASIHFAGDELRLGASDVLRNCRASNGESPGTVGKHSRQETGGLHRHIHPSARLPAYLHEVKDVYRPGLSRHHGDVTYGKGTVLYQLQKLHIVEFYIRRSLRSVDRKVC
jgi:hypothetical protein